MRPNNFMRLMSCAMLSNLTFKSMIRLFTYLAFNIYGINYLLVTSYKPSKGRKTRHIIPADNGVSGCFTLRLTRIMVGLHLSILQKYFYASYI